MSKIFPCYGLRMMMCDRAKRGSFPENFTSLRVKFSFLFFGSFFSFFRKKRKNTASELRGSSFMSFRVASELRAREARLASASLGGSVSWQLRCLGFSQQSQLRLLALSFAKRPKPILGKQQSNNQVSFAV